MPGAIGVRSCGVQRAAVYQRRRPERVVGWYFRTARRVTCGGARVSVVQALAECGERFGLPVPAYRSCAVSTRKVCQSCQKFSEYSLSLQHNGWAGVSGNWCLISVAIGGTVYDVEVAGRLNCLFVTLHWRNWK